MVPSEVILTTLEHIARARLLGYTGYNKRSGTYFTYDPEARYIDCMSLEPVTLAETIKRWHEGKEKYYGTD